MKKAVKRVGLGLGAIALLVILCAAAVFAIGNARIARIFDNVGHDLVLPTDSASIANGDRLSTAYGCRDCHGDDLGGTKMIDEPAFAVLAAPNLTAGPGGIGSDYSPTDWERAIRHGVARDGRALVIMPSGSYSHFSDRDIGEIVAYLRQAAPVARSFDPPRMGAMSRLAAAMAGGELVPAIAIEHEAAHPEPVERAPSAAFGEYLAQGCKGCHGQDFSGSAPAMGDDVAAANLTPHPDTGLGGWSFADFERVLRTGTRPDGTQLSEAMPVAALSALTEDEIAALWMYLQSLPAVDADRRLE
jgi:cytochrome c553